MNRVLSVARVQLITWPLVLGWPLAIMFSSFAVNLALFAAIGDKIPGEHVTGGLASIYVVQLIVYTQAMTHTFSFAVGLNATRRAFYLGTATLAIGHSLLYGILLYGLKAIEHATHGWGVSLGFFDVGPLTHGNNPLTILVYTVPMVLCAFLGMLVGVVTKRWGTNGVFALTVAASLVFGGAAFLITQHHGWSTVGSWLADQPGLALAAGWPLIPLVVVAAGSYGLLRRATP